MIIVSVPSQVVDSTEWADGHLNDKNEDYLSLHGDLQFALLDSSFETVEHNLWIMTILYNILIPSEDH